MNTNVRFLNQLLKKKGVLLLLAFLILTPSFASKAKHSSDEITISLNIENQSITEVFDIIEKKTYFTFILMKRL